MKPRFAGWELVVSALAGVAAGFVMPANFYAEGVAEIVTVLGFLIASFVPAMVLAATSIRAGGFSVLRIRELGTAIERQIQVFGGLFIYAFITCIIVISGKLLHWVLPSFTNNTFHYEISVDLSIFYPVVLTYLFVFLGLRTLTFVGGVLSILRLTTFIAEDEARLRDRDRRQSGADELSAYKMPERYGSKYDAM